MNFAEELALKVLRDKYGTCEEWEAYVALFIEHLYSEMS